ncbi:MAG: hypothetical protein ACXU9U_01685 [Parachlamydiaceae bacterium]
MTIDLGFHIKNTAVEAIAGAAAAPIVSTLTSHVATVAFAVHPLQGAVFCGTLGFLKSIYDHNFYKFNCQITTPTELKIKQAVDAFFLLVASSALVYTSWYFGSAAYITFGAAAATYLTATALAGVIHAIYSASSTKALEKA